MGARLDPPAADRTVAFVLERQAAALAERPALRVGGESRTYREIRDAIARTAAALRDAGVRRGDRVAIMCANRIEAIELVYGCAWCGALAVPVNTALRGEQLAHVLADSGASALAVDTGCVPAVAALGALPATLRAVWLLDDAEGDGVDARPLPPGVDVRPLPRSAEPAPPIAAGPGDPMAIMYTSGTSGVSKGVLCTNAQLVRFGVHLGAHFDVRPDDVLHNCLPLFHVNALATFMHAAVNGASFVVGGRFSASRFWREIVASGATITFLLGAMVSILLKRDRVPEEREHRLRAVLAPATPADAHRAFEARFGAALVEGYASTETNYALGTAAGAARPGYIGRVFDDFEARVVDESDIEVPDGTAGELLLRNREPFDFALGYHGRPERTVEAWRNLWFHTGDRVVREPDGWFRFEGRLTDSIRRRGENISCFEVERVLARHPGVEEVAVFGVPSELGEEEVMAAVVARGALDPAELVAFCAERIAAFAVPRYVDVVGELPRTQTGRVQKWPLRERGVTSSTWDAEA